MHRVRPHLHRLLMGGAALLAMSVLAWGLCCQSSSALRREVGARPDAAHAPRESERAAGAIAPARQVRARLVGPGAPDADKLEILRASVTLPSGDPFEQVPLLRRDEAHGGRGPAGSRRERHRRLLARTTAQIALVSEAIARAKADQSRSPEELAEAEEALERLKAAESQLAASVAGTP